MASVDFGDGPVEFEVSFWTLLLYEEEFDGADLIRDIMPTEGTVPWACAIRALWACLKAHDDATPPVKEWARGITGVNMFSVIGTVMPAIQDGLFREAPSEA